MESGLVVLTVVAMIAVGVFIVLMDKAKSAASRALSQKVLYRKKFEQGKHLLEGMTLDSAAPCERLLRDLQTRVAVSDPPTGLANRLYTAGRQGNRIEYVYGNKFGDSFRARVVILEHGERSLGIFKVVRWHEQEGIIVAQDWMKTLFEQVRAVVVAADPAATFTEGINDARLKKAAAPDAAAKAEETPVSAPSEPALSAGSEDAVARAGAPAAPAIQAPTPIAVPSKRMNTWSYIGTAVLAAAILWIGTVGVPADLMPVWLLVAGAGGAMFYFSTRAPRARAVPTRPAQPSAPEPPQPPAESASALGVSTSAQEPSIEQFALAAEELSVVGRKTEATAPREPWPSKSFARGLVIVGAVVMTAIVGVAVVNGVSKATSRHTDPGIAGDSTVTTSESGDDDYVMMADRGPDDVDPFTLSPDIHQRYNEDLFASAPADGSAELLDVVHLGSDTDDFNINSGLTIVGRTPAEWYDLEIPLDLGYYIDGSHVTVSEFLQAVNAEEHVEGMIVFDRERVYELHVFTRGQSASDDPRLAGGEVSVPDYEAFDITAEEWDTLDWGEAMTAYIGAIEEGFADAGLVGNVELVYYTGTEQPTQDPPAGASVPAGTIVHITIPSSS